MLVSIIIPAYNSATFLPRAMGSALAQTWTDLEVIVVDDASTDQTAAVAAELAREDPRVRPVRRPVNGGVSAARNAGLATARGEWIMMLDADDTMAPVRVATLVELAARTGAELVADNQFYHDGHADRDTGTALPWNGVPEHRLVDADTFVAHGITGRSDFDYGMLKPMLGRGLFDKHGLAYDEGLRHGEDFYFVLRALLFGASLAVTTEPLYHYTTRVGAASGVRSDRQRAQLDYAKMRRANERFHHQHRPHLSPAAGRLLRERSRAIGRLATLQTIGQAVRQRRVAQALWAGLSNPPVYAEIGRRALARWRAGCTGERPGAAASIGNPS